MLMLLTSWDDQRKDCPAGRSQDGLRRIVAPSGEGGVKKETQQIAFKSFSDAFTVGSKLASGKLRCLINPGALWQYMLVRDGTHSR